LSGASTTLFGFFSRHKEKGFIILITGVIYSQGRLYEILMAVIYEWAKLVRVLVPG
jgi:hypothetical protein